MLEDRREVVTEVIVSFNNEPRQSGDDRIRNRADAAEGVIRHAYVERRPVHGPCYVLRAAKRVVRMIRPCSIRCDGHSDLAQTVCARVPGERGHPININDLEGASRDIAMNRRRVVRLF